MNTYETPTPPRLRLRIPAGRIEIATWDQPVTEVLVEPASPGDSAAAEAAAGVRQDVRETGDGQEIVVESTGRRGLLGIRRDPELRATIRAPHGSRLDAESASADVTVVGRLAEARIETASGDVSVGDVGGPASLKTVSGDIEAGAVAGEARSATVSGDVELRSVEGEATLTSVSGDLRVGWAGSSLRAKTVSGDVLLDAVTRGEVKLQSVSGDITVGVAAGARLWMDVASLSGETRSDLEPLGGHEGDREVELRISANSTSGDVRLFRAAGVAPA
jgi:Putative adhesin